MNKALVFQHLIKALQSQLDTAEKAAKQAYESATHKENVAENKYDTLGLEASYLAEGQAKRVAQCREALTIAKQLSTQQKAQSEAIKVGSVVTLCNANNEKQLFLISPIAGGTKLEFQGQHITVITPSSPVGKQLIGLKRWDEVALNILNEPQHVEVQAIH